MFHIATILKCHSCWRKRPYCLFHYLPGPALNSFCGKLYHKIPIEKIIKIYAAHICYLQLAKRLISGNVIFMNSVMFAVPANFFVICCHYFFDSK